MKLMRLLSLWILLLLASGCSGLLGGSPKVSVNNQSGADICEIYLSKENSIDWGSNYLGEEEILATGEIRVLSPGGGTYDLLVRNCQEEVVFSVSEIKSGYEALIGGPDKIALRLENHSPQEICYVMAQEPAAAEPVDQLGKVESILGGSSRIFFVSPGLYDLRAEDCNHNPISEILGIDLSGPFTWAVE